MSSRRKSSNPCMVRLVRDPPEEQDDPGEVMDVDVSAENDGTDKEPAREAADPRPESPENPDRRGPEAEGRSPEPGEADRRSGDKDEAAAGDEKVGEAEEADPESQKKQPKGYECKYCPFVTQNLNDFKEHVDSSHPNVILNPLYLCAVCNFNTKKFDLLTEHNERRHPGETNFKFKRIKMNNQTVLEQTIEGKDDPASCREPDERRAFPPCVAASVKTPDATKPPYQGGDLKSHLDGLIQKDRIAALNINGTVIIPEPSILQGLSHVSPMLQRPPNFNAVPKIAVPLNTTKYNPSLDDNLTLITSFNKFPYPTHAELSWLTAASKHPEEQIKVWFTTQRLKQGITWSPEEVEEARKKMFNGSIPPAHHTFTVPPTSPVSQSSAKASQQPVVHAAVERPAQVRTTASDGFGAVAGLKRSLSTHPTSPFGPDAKRPVMAVAPNPGDPKDKGLMAPPPPPPPQKDRHPMAPPPVPAEMKRPVAAPPVAAEVKRSPAAVPLMPPPPPSLSLSPSSSSKGKNLPTLGNLKTKPLVSLPSMVFPESLTRPMIAPPPICAPPFKNSFLIPRSAPMASKEKHPNTYTLTPADLKLPTSPPPVASQVRRPTIIQSVHAPTKTPSQIPGFPPDGKKLKEQHGVEMKAGFPRGDKGLAAAAAAAEANGTSREGGKWFNHPSPLGHNNGMVHLDGGEPAGEAKQDFQQKSSSVLTQFPLLERMKGKTAEQLKILEENFLNNSFPTHNDVDNLAAATRLSQQEIDSWFVERRALRDNLEIALLNSMGNKRLDKRLQQQQQQQQQQHQTLQLNGTHKPSHLKSPPPSSHALPIIAPGAAPPSNSNSCSVPPDSRFLALLKDDFAQTRWPSPEEFSQAEGRSGLVRTNLSRWFGDGRATEHFHNNGLNGGQVTAPMCSPKNTPCGLVRRCPDGAVTSNSSGKVLEVELGWLMEQRGSNFGAPQHDELQDRFASRLRQQQVSEVQPGGQNGGVVGGARGSFSSWLAGGPELLDRDKMAEDGGGRLTA